VIFPIRTELARTVEGFLRGIDNERRAEKEAEENLRAHPNDAAAYARLAHEVGGHDKIRSISLLNEAIKRDSTKLEYYLNAGITSERINGGSGNDYGRAAIRLAYASLQQDPSNLNRSINYAIALDLAGEEGRASAIYDSLMKIHPSESRLMFNAACCYARQAKADRALDILRTLLQTNPGRKDEVKYDPDFDNIRSNPGYLQLIYGFGK
jgi:Tfp pilus assembly protein PilF